MARAALYVRHVVGLDGDLDLLAAELRAVADARGWTAFVYEDRGFGGSREERPAFDRLCADVRAGQVDVVVTHRLARMARSSKHALDLVADLRERRVGLVALAEGLDSTTTEGAIALGVLGRLAGLDNEILAEAVQAGLRHLRRAGGAP